ncbi:hypothetical protein Taro_013485 [Colocasia esculenta]|uniref:Uncharacterized protein n=1 Tax=Colocasia esculenta TaxID=4460 RepID=A0A843UG22_COLES|nr:hypothetical protein [Colocasia esculenta]
MEAINNAPSVQGWQSRVGWLGRPQPIPTLSRGRLGLSRDSELCKPVLWVGRCSPPRVGSPGANLTQSRPTQRLRSESADSAIHASISQGILDTWKYFSSIVAEATSWIWLQSTMVNAPMP